MVLFVVFKYICMISTLRECFAPVLLGVIIFSCENKTYVIQKLLFIIPG